MRRDGVSYEGSDVLDVAWMDAMSWGRRLETVVPSGDADEVSDPAMSMGHPTMAGVAHADAPWAIVLTKRPPDRDARHSLRPGHRTSSVCGVTKIGGPPDRSMGCSPAWPE